MDNNNSNNNFVIPEAILSDLCSRFIINVPEEERNDLIRIFFQIEIAHWFYLDFYCASDFSAAGSSSSSSSSSHSSSASASSSSSSSLSSDDNENDDINLVKQKPAYSSQTLKPCSIRIFAEQIFRYCPFLMQHSNQVDEILSNWKVFKHAVPTNGAIIMDESMRYVLLVQGFWAKASWGFPKGKVFEEETEAKCAAREVLEETGYDISQQMVEDEHLQININDQTIRLYLVPNVPKSTHFEPRTRREIKEVRWFAIDELPVHRKDNRTKYNLGYSPNAFFMVIPFVKALKKWIAAKNSARTGQVVNGGFISNNSSSAGLGLTSSSSGNKLAQTGRSHNHHHHRRRQNSQNQNNSSYYANTNSNSNFNDSTSLFNNSSNSNGGGGSSYKKVSRSNENLSSSSRLVSNNIDISNSGRKSKVVVAAMASSNNKSNTSNAFLKHFSNGFSSLQYQPASQQQSPNKSSSYNVESVDVDSNNNNVKSQNGQHYFQKIQQNEYADIIGVKQAALSNRSNQNSNFKAKNYNNSQNNNQSVNNKLKTNNSNNGMNINTNINSSTGRKRTVSLNKDTSFSNTKNSISFNQNNGIILNNQPEQQVNLNAIRKQLNFNGPECWVNFKFDYSSILENLPPILDL